MILIVSEKGDAHVPWVTARLDALGAEYSLFDPAELPATARLAVAYGRRGLSRCVLYRNGRRIDLAGVRAVWYRRPGLPQPLSPVRDPELRRWAADALSHTLHGMLETLDCVWVPGRPSQVEVAGLKVSQLAVAARLGFPIPRTLVTSRPEDFVAFYARHAGRLVSKAPWRSRTSPATFTHAVRRRDARLSHAIRHAPVIFQEYVPKRLEVRVTVIGPQAFAAEIHSQELPSTLHDSRRWDDRRPRHAPHELPSSVERLCVRLVRALGLRFGAIDLILTPAGKYVFLEMNPNGQWAWIESLTGQPIAAAIADLLVRGRARPREGARPAR